MKKLIVILLFGLLVVVTGCIFGDDDDDDDKDKKGGTGTSQSASAYFPLADGVSWAYSETATSYWDGEETDTDTYAVTCKGTEVLNGKTYWKFEADYVETYLRLDGDDVYEYDPEFYLKISKAAEKKGKPAPLAKLAASLEDPTELLLYRFNRSAGYTWTIYSDSSTEGGYSYSATMTGKFVGIESVTVPAGTFADCAKFEIASVQSYSGGGQSQSSTNTLTSWFAPGICLIKETEVEKEGNDVMYNSVSVLGDYHLAGGER